MSVVEYPIEHGTDGGHVSQQFAPILHWAIGRQQCAGAFVAPHNDLPQILGRVSGSLRMRKASMIGRGTVVSDSINCLRVPSTTASASSSSRTCVSRYNT